MSLYERLGTAVFGPERFQELLKNPKEANSAREMLEQDPQTFSRAVHTAGPNASMAAVGEKIDDIKMYQQMVENERVKLDAQPLEHKGIKPIDVKDLSIHAAELMANIGAIYQNRATLKDVENGPTGNGSTLAQNAKGKTEIKFNELTGKKESGLELGS